MSDFHGYDEPVFDTMAEAIGEALLHDRAQIPPVVIGQCEYRDFDEARRVWARCESDGMLVLINAGMDHVFRCPKHGATLERAIRRWP